MFMYFFLHYVLCEILRFKEFGLVTSFWLRFLFYRTGFRHTIYGGRLLLVIALVIATWQSTVFINPNVKKRHQK